MDTNSTFLRANKDIIKAAVTTRSGITSADASSYHVINYNYDNGNPYNYVHVRIFARDDNYRPRLGGGDFWTALMFSDKFRTSGHVVDHENGTYSVFFVRAWEGEAHINITLIHSSAATQYIKTFIWPTFRLMYEGTFQQGDITEHAFCTILSSSDVWLDNPKCVYQSKTSLGNHVFTCDTPKKLPCSSLVRYGNTPSSNIPQSKIMSSLLKGKKMLFHG